MEAPKLIKIINDGRFLIATMPNGDVIPCQIDLIVKNGIEVRGMTEVIVTLKAHIPTEDIEIMKHVKEQ